MDITLIQMIAQCSTIATVGLMMESKHAHPEPPFIQTQMVPLIAFQKINRRMVEAVDMGSISSTCLPAAFKLTDPVLKAQKAA